MDILKAFKLTEESFDVNIKGDPENPLFQANQIAEILDIKSFRSSILDFDESEKVTIKTITNGGYQNVIFLTEYGLYKLIGRSKKKEAKIFQRWVINIIKELRLTGKYELKKENEIEKNLLEHKVNVDIHKALLKAYDNKNVIYLCKLRSENDEKILIKIGSSQNIKERILNIKEAYDNIDPLLIDLIETNRYIKFENYIHNHEYFKQYKYTILNKQNKESKETYLVNDKQLKEFIRLINIEKNKFNDINIIELENIKLKQEEAKIKQEEIKDNKIINEIKYVEIQLNIKKIEYEILQNKASEEEINVMKNKLIILENEVEKIKNINNDSDDIEEKEEDDIDMTTIFFQTKKNTYGIKIPYVYQYHPSDLYNPIKIYESPSDVERAPELSHLEISPAPLRLATRNNTIYKGFRWYYVKRNENPPESIPTTVENKHKEPEIKFIAMIDITKTKILAVYPNQKEATKARLMKANSFHRAIQNGSISSGHYWNYFDSCSEDMQQEYLKNNSLPEKYIRSISKKVEQICPLTKKVLKMYNSNREVIKNFKMSVSSLKKYSDSGEIHNGYIWKIV
jgi:prophage antirepressor-like protein